jgi:phage tail sheath protein FI
MSETFLHGVQVLEVDTGARPIRTVRSSVIGLVGQGNFDGAAAQVTIGTSNSQVRFYALSNGANANAFSIRCIKPSTNNAALSVTCSGNVITISLATDGSAVATSTATQVQTAFNAAGITIPTATGTVTINATASVVGSNGTGLYAVHTSTALVGGVNDTFPLNTPVLVTNPSGIDAALGADTYLGKALEAIFKQSGALVVVVNDGGEGGGDATSFTGIYALKRAQAALGYTPRIIVAKTPDTDIEDIKSVCDSCRAIAIVGIPETTATDATQWMEDNANDRVYGLWPSVNGGEDPAPYVAGVLAKSDNDKGFWWSPSNQEVFGINSLDYPVDFQLGDTTSLANVLNEGKVTTFIRQGGFRVWGNLTGSIDAKWQFLSVRRTADIINDSILYNHLWAVDRNITRTYLEDVSDGVNNYLSTLTNLGAIIGGKCWPDPALNSPDQIALGKVYFNFEFTPPYPAQTVTFRSILTNDYLSELID